MKRIRTVPGAGAARGFTLVEIMIAMTLLVVIIGATMQVLVSTNVASERINRIGSLQNTARLALEGMGNDIRSAGLGVSSGQVGVSPGSGAGTSAARIPVIYSGPDTTITEPGGPSLVTNSIFIIGAEPGTVGLAGDGTGMQGVVALVSSGTALSIICATAAGASVDCSTTAGALLPALAPLIVGDFRNAVYLRPTSLGSPGGTPAVQSLDFTERSSGSFSPDPKAPFGFAPGATISQARVVHWYLRQDSASAPPRLYRSHPRIGADTTKPFVDETNGDPAADPKGTEMGAGPIESLQIRYVTDPNHTDDPAQFQMRSSIAITDTAVMADLREVRIQLVSISASPDKNTSASGNVVRYSTPAFEGTSPSTAALDAYPRRSFTSRVVPRGLQGVRL